MLIAALRDKALKAVQKHMSSPKKMRTNSCPSWAAKTTVNTRSTCSKVIRTKKGDTPVSYFIANSETIFAQLDSAGHSLNDMMQVCILLSSIKKEKEYEAVTAATRTLRDSGTTRETVAA